MFARLLEGDADTSPRRQRFANAWRPIHSSKKACQCLENFLVESNGRRRRDSRTRSRSISSKFVRYLGFKSVEVFSVCLPLAPPDIRHPRSRHHSCFMFFFILFRTIVYSALYPKRPASFVLKLYKYSSRPMGYDAVIHPTHRTPSLSFTKSFAMSLSPVIQGTHERHILTLSFISRRQWLTNKSTSLVRCIRCVYL